MMTDKIEEIIGRDGFVLEMTYGNSMQPMLKQCQNPIIISKLASVLKKSDVILFKDASGKYLLHRIVKVTEHSYITRGDNRIVTECVNPGDVVGILTGYYKGEKFIDCKKNCAYKIYSFLITKYYYFRVFKWKIHLLFKKIIRR